MPVNIKFESNKPYSIKILLQSLIAKKTFTFSLHFLSTESGTASEEQIISCFLDRMKPFIRILSKEYALTKFMITDYDNLESLYEFNLLPQVSGQNKLQPCPPDRSLRIKFGTNLKKKYHSIFLIGLPNILDLSLFNVILELTLMPKEKIREWEQTYNTPVQFSVNPSPTPLSNPSQNLTSGDEMENNDEKRQQFNLGPSPEDQLFSEELEKSVLTLTDAVFALKILVYCWSRPMVMNDLTFRPCFIRLQRVKGQVTKVAEYQDVTSVQLIEFITRSRTKRSLTNYFENKLKRKKQVVISTNQFSQLNNMGINTPIGLSAVSPPLLQNFSTLTDKDKIIDTFNQSTKFLDQTGVDSKEDSNET